MAVITYPLNNLDFTAEDVGIYNSTRTTGIFAGDDFSATLTGNDNTITVGAGMAWMRLQKFFGVAVAMKTQTAVDMGLPDTNYPRIDAIILKFDANKNNTELVVKKGTASSSPQPPEVTRTEATHEIHLYQVRREPSATAITASKVTDLRLNASYCGLMSDAVSSVDTATINAQITALIQELEDALKDVEDQTYYASKTYVDEQTEAVKSYADEQTEAVKSYADEQTEAVKSYADEQISQAAAEVNLLDNSDFQHFVAQAGVAGNHGTQAYAGDRWILDSGTVTGTENANGNGYSGITLNGTIRQIVAEPPAGQYACAVEMVSGTATIAYAGGEVTITSSGGVLKNAGLYAGSRAPKYVPKGYSAELLECKRYYLKGVFPATIGPTYGRGSIFTIVVDRMRVSPTHTLGEISAEGWGDVNASNYVAGWGTADGSKYYANYRNNSNADDVGKTVAARAEFFADL